MKTMLHKMMVLVLGLCAFTGATGQKTSSDNDDLYYRPSDNKQAPATVKQETVNPQSPAYEPDDYEKYINNLENQRATSSTQEYSNDTLEYAQDPQYVGSDYYEKDGNTYITNNYYNTDDYQYATQLRRFYDPYYSAGYYDPWYYDPYWYAPGWSFGMSFGFPYMGFSLSFGWPYYSSWYSPYYYGGYYQYDQRCLVIDLSVGSAPGRHSLGFEGLHGNQ